jgi:hypothetical protein
MASMMPVIPRIVGEKSFEDLTIPLAEVMDVSIHLMTL